ncbi:hypothetical protein SETIT_7G068800v2 [Setaria italica]|uniref:Uncharacterized protein n=1 Tax=Setaria italica TaxID=4555 RepID=A0A368RT52_SETIT|nr:hypothetical protein SETIT_7G068800v2 [Setaria italica]
MQENDVHVVKEKTEYLDPYAICKVKHNFPCKWGDSHGKLAKLKTQKERRAKQLEEKKSYEEGFSLHSAYDDYGLPSTTLPEEGFITPRDRKKWLYAQTFHATSNHLVLYIAGITCASTAGCSEDTQLILNVSRLHEQQLLNTNANLCRFILREVVNPMGIFYYTEYELAQDDKYISLHEWENQVYRQG